MTKGVLQLVKNHIAINVEQAMDMLSVDEKNAFRYRKNLRKQIRIVLLITGS
mgnify:CR=1 FL=1